MIKQCILSLLCLLWAGQTLLAGELRERVYLQTDKQFYLSGELVWMKFIATDLDQRLSDVSKVGYVELLDSASAVVQARLVLEKGVGDGCLQTTIAHPLLQHESGLHDRRGAIQKLHIPDLAHVG